MAGGRIGTGFWAGPHAKVLGQVPRVVSQTTEAVPGGARAFSDKELVVFA